MSKNKENSGYVNKLMTREKKGTCQFSAKRNKRSSMTPLGRKSDV